MKVNFNVKPHKGTRFKNIEKGSIFGYETRRAFRYFMKTEATPCGNGVDLEDGSVETFYPDDFVMELQGETNVWY